MRLTLAACFLVVGCSGSATKDAASANEPDSGSAVDSAGPDLDTRVDGDAATGDMSIAPSQAQSCTDGVVGTWQNITPPDVQAVLTKEGNTATSGGANPSWGIATVLVDPKTPSTIYASADGQGIFKSLDCGGTWARVDNPSDGFAKSTGSVYSWAMAIDPEDPQTIYANDGYGPSGVWKSSDGGQNFSQTFVGNLVGPGMGAGMPVTSVFIYGGFIGSIRIDPTNHLHVLVAPHHQCVAPFSDWCLLETFDGAKTWTVVTTTLASDNADGPVADLIDSKHYYSMGLPGSVLYESTDSGATWSTAANIKPTPYGFVYHSPTTKKYFLPSVSGVLQSDDGIAWTVIDNSPIALNSGAIAGDGTTLYAAHTAPGFDPAFSTASESDPTKWTQIDSPQTNIGYTSLVPEPVNKFLYVSAGFGGLWRYGIK